LWHVFGEAPGQAEQAQLRVDREPVAALSLEGRGPVREHLGGERPGLGEDHVVAHSGQRARRGADAAAGSRDLLVGDTGHLHLVLLRPPPRERQVRMTVDEPGDDGTAPGVDLPDSGRIGFEAGDPVPLEGHGSGLGGERVRAVMA